MAEIAGELERALAHRALNGTPGKTVERRIAQGEGWTVSDVVCTRDLRDRPFEERHKGFSIAVVAAGSFQYRSCVGRSANRSRAARELMTPGSILFGNPGQAYECGHEHDAGDRCVSFWYAPDYFERIAAAAGAPGGRLELRVLRLPPLRELSSVVARVCSGLAGKTAKATNLAQTELLWEELSLQLAAHTLRLLDIGRFSLANNAPPSAVARVTRAVRTMERYPDAQLNLARLAREAGLSPYHFLRTFERLTGVTPHQYLLRARLRHAAMRLAAEPGKILDIALDCGFADVSNFNRAFRAEFGVTPSRFRGKAARSAG